MTRRNRFPAETYINGILAGDRIKLSQAITLIESRLESDRTLAEQVLAGCLPHAGRAFRLGITGVPGVGKSTFIDGFGTYLTQQQKKQIAVLAIDPSSRDTKGSILGDKTRMQQLSRDQHAFIRPSPTGGTLGGVANKTRETILLCEAAGYDWILVETVGVGQSEFLVADMVDGFLLLMLPNAGDDLQGIKKGIMEMADFLVINKADGAFELPAQKAQRLFQQALHLLPPKVSQWYPQVLTVSALYHKGYEALWEHISDYHTQVKQSGYLALLRASQRGTWFEQLVQEKLFQALLGGADIQEKYSRMKAKVKSGTLVPAQAANQLLTELLP